MKAITVLSAVSLLYALGLFIQLAGCSPNTLPTPPPVTLSMNSILSNLSNTTINDSSSITHFTTLSPNRATTLVIIDGKGVDDKLQTICQLLGTHPSNCTCEMYPQFCEDHKTEHVVSEPTPCQPTSMERIEKSLVLVISFFGIIGNILVLIVRVRNWKKSLHYRLISGLAIADLTFCCMSVLITTPALFTCRWKLGGLLCTFLKTFRTMSSNVDLGFILIIAIERYIGIVHPFGGGASAFKIYIVVGCNLLAGFLAAFPFFLVFKINGSEKCSEDWSIFHANASFVYGWVSNIFLFLIPIIATGVLYYRGLKTLKSTLFRQEMMLTLDETSRRNLVGENHRILRIISTILLAFLFLVGPNHLAWFIHDNMTVPIDIEYYIFRVSMILYALHTSINPIIYSIIDRKFRRNVYFMLRNGRRRKSFTTTTTANLHISPVHMQTVVSRADPEGACSSLGGSHTSSRIIDEHHLDDISDLDDGDLHQRNQDQNRNNVESV